MWRNFISASLNLTFKHAYKTKKMVYNRSIKLAYDMPCSLQTSHFYNLLCPSFGHTKKCLKKKKMAELR